MALDDFDVELAAMLREYLFVPGMGETTARRFRDKLAMRRRARSSVRTASIETDSSVPGSTAPKPKSIGVGATRTNATPSPESQRSSRR